MNIGLKCSDSFFIFTEQAGFAMKWLTRDQDCGLPLAPIAPISTGARGEG